jgi:hypothetical protein
MKSGNLNFLEPSGPLQAWNGTALPLPLPLPLPYLKYIIFHIDTSKIKCASKIDFYGGKNQGKLRSHLHYCLTRYILMSTGFHIGNCKIETEQTALTDFKGNISISYNFATTVLSAVNFKVQIQFLGDVTPYWLVNSHKSFEDSINLRNIGKYTVYQRTQRDLPQV